MRLVVLFYDCALAPDTHRTLIENLDKLASSASDPFRCVDEVVLPRTYDHHYVRLCKSLQ
jgi:hypothetical protein